MNRNTEIKTHKISGILPSLIIISSFSYPSSTQEIFTDIYHNCGWHNRESDSGPGSTLNETRIIREKLIKLLKKLNAKSLLDAPCGDFNWMKEVDLSFLHYYGCDIVQEIIDINKTKYENEQRSFFYANIINDPLPYADVILCRDCLVHFPFDYIALTLKNIKDSGIKYFIATTFPKTTLNKNLKKSGGWRPLNLQLPPFNFPPPIELIVEGCKHDPRFPDKSLGVWLVEDIMAS